MDPAFRHIALCNTAILPGGRTRLSAAGHPIGWVAPDLLPALLAAGMRLSDAGLVAEPGRLQPIARALAGQGLFTWRDEPFDVRPAPGAPAIAAIDRGALPLLGIAAEGVHLNGLVAGPDGPLLWVARRAADKLLDPGKLDHLVAGGIPAGLSPAEALAKEAAEEAGIPAELIARAEPRGAVDYAMARDEGLRRDRLHCYDLVLPADFVPEPRDGEVESFELWPLPRVLDRVRATGDFKFNVPLVLIPLFQRHGLLPV